MNVKNLFNIGCQRNKGCKSGGKRKDGYVDSITCGQYEIDFYEDDEAVENCKIEIRVGVVMETQLRAGHEGYAFLMQCYRDGAKDAIEAYCTLLFLGSHLLAVDAKYPKVVHTAWDKWMKARQAEAEKLAASVTAEQNEADEALMQEAVRISEMSEDARGKLAEEVADKLYGIMETEEAAKAEAEKTAKAEAKAEAKAAKKSAKVKKNKKK